MFQYKQMIEYMATQAEKHRRNFLRDVFSLIATYYTVGYDSIDEIIRKWTWSREYEEELISMRDIYGIDNSPKQNLGSLPSLCKICEAFPHVSLVFSDMIKDSLATSNLWFYAESDDVGADVQFHIKMNYFPALIDLDEGGLKAQVCFLLYNLCNAKAIIKNDGKKKRSVVAAFMRSCKLSSHLAKQSLAPLQSRRKFTEFIQSQPVDAELLCCVWNKVIGKNILPVIEELMISHFHKKVLMAQPLNLRKWNQLL